MKDTFEKMVRNLYNEVWNDWFDRTVDTQAQLIIKILTQEEIDAGTDTTSGYHIAEDKIYLYIPEGNMGLDNSDYFSHFWPQWKTELIHELIHEYQHKKKVVPTNEGVNLLNSKHIRFDGPGHDEVFYTIICEKANYFNMSPDKLLANI